MSEQTGVTTRSKKTAKPKAAAKKHVSSLLGRPLLAKASSSPPLSPKEPSPQLSPRKPSLSPKLSSPPPLPKSSTPQPSPTASPLKKPHSPVVYDIEEQPWIETRLSHSDSLDASGRSNSNVNVVFRDEYEKEPFDRNAEVSKERQRIRELEAEVDRANRQLEQERKTRQIEQERLSQRLEEELEEQEHREKLEQQKHRADRLSETDKLEKRLRALECLRDTINEPGNRSLFEKEERKLLERSIEVHRQAISGISDEIQQIEYDLKRRVEIIGKYPEVAQVPPLWDLFAERHAELENALEEQRQQLFKPSKKKM